MFPILAAVLLLSSCSFLAEASHGHSTSMHITCDNRVEGVYLDGRRTSVAAATDWTRAGQVTVPGSTRVVAVQCSDHGVIEGVLMSSSNGLVSDATWRCTHLYERGWTSAHFDDSHWPHARVRGSQGSYPWNRVVQNIATNAKWIWSPVLRSRVYCRASYSRSRPSRLSVTCDNAVGGLYLDGRSASVPYASDWTRAGSVLVPQGTRVVAIYCRDYGVIEGVLMSSSTGLITDARWKCTDRPERGWTSPSFNDSHWPNAIVRGSQGSSPWNRIVGGIAGNAKWIWSPRLTSRVYCRARYV